MSTKTQGRTAHAPPQDPDLVAVLERPLAPLPVGRAGSAFLYGHVWHPHDVVERLELLVDGVAHRPAAAGMPRPDLHHLTCGFWGVVPIPAPRRAGAVTVRAAVWLRDRGRAEVELGRMEVVAPAPARAIAAAPADPRPGLIAICMATFEPDPALFAAQVASLQAQTERRWVCLVSDDGSAPEHLERIAATIGDDPRFELSPSPRRQGFYRNFERALGMVPAEAELVALCDQDDRWHPDKLATLHAALGDAVLAFSDQRLVDARGRVLRDTLWAGRRVNATDLASMVVANTVTGAATLFRRELAELALPFPETPGFQFHDHWLGVVALAAGELAYVDRPLYDYVQHAGAIFGDVTGGPGRSRGRGPRAVLERWRADYYFGWVTREMQAQTALGRCAQRLSPAKRRVLERFGDGARSPAALAWLALRPLRMLAGRTETLGGETELALGLLWRRLIVTRARIGGPRRMLGDASLPDPFRFEQRRLRRWRAAV